ncbi:hypothetical protein CLOM_g22882 [Closterium sp. NIES-68]|nr:hypothetical protein CLOM_g22882 [Closterium sp. NIES-68]GJP62513.1 hypothetical protein CLOP_g19563 [Closterium sp. NIES-67]
MKDIFPPLALPLSLEGMPSSPEQGSDIMDAKPTMSKGTFERCSPVEAVFSLLSRRLFIAALALTVASIVTLGIFQTGDQARVAITGGIIVKTEAGGINGSGYSPSLSPPDSQPLPSPHLRSEIPPSTTAESPPAAHAPVPFKPPAPAKETGYHREYALVDKYDWHQLDNQRAHVCYAGVPCSFVLLVPKHALNGTNHAGGGKERAAVGEGGAGAAKLAAKSTKSAKRSRFDDEILELERLLLPHTEILLSDVMVTLYGPSLQHASLVSQTATPNGPLLQLSVLIWDVGDYRGVVRADCTHESAVGTRYYPPVGPGEVRYFRMQVLSPDPPSRLSTRASSSSASVSATGLNSASSAGGGAGGGAGEGAGAGGGAEWAGDVGLEVAAIPSPCSVGTFARWLRRPNGSYKWTSYTCAAMSVALIGSRNMRRVTEQRARKSAAAAAGAAGGSRKLLAAPEPAAAATEGGAVDHGRALREERCEEKGPFACESKKQLLRDLLVALGPALEEDELALAAKKTRNGSVGGGGGAGSGTGDAEGRTEEGKGEEEERQERGEADSGIPGVKISTRLALVGDSHMRNLFYDLTYSLLRDERVPGKGGEKREGGSLGGQSGLRMKSNVHGQMCSLISSSGLIRACHNSEFSVVDADHDDVARSAELDAAARRKGKGGKGGGAGVEGRGREDRWMEIRYHWIDGLYRNGLDGCVKRGQYSGRDDSFPTISPTPDVLVADSAHWSLAFCTEPEVAYARSLPMFLDWLISVRNTSWSGGGVAGSGGEGSSSNSSDGSSDSRDSSSGSSSGSSTGTNSSIATAQGRPIRSVLFVSAPPFPTGSSRVACAGRTNQGLVFANSLAKTLAEREGIMFVDLWHVAAPRYLDACGMYNPHYTCEYQDRIEGEVGHALTESLVWALQRLLLPKRVEDGE